MDPAYPHHEDPAKFKAWLFSRLKEIPGVEWDETKAPMHSSYEDWWAWGTSVSYTPAVSPGDSSKTPSSRADSPTSPHRPSLPGRTTSSRRTSADKALRAANYVIARVSRHNLRLERQYQIARSHVAEHDPDGIHYVRPLQLFRLSPRQGQDNDPLMTVIVYTCIGYNDLTDMINCGPALFKTTSVPLLSTWKPNLVCFGEGEMSQVSVATFLRFAIGACESLEILHHGNRLVHGELRPDSFHFSESSGLVRLCNLGSGVRSLEYGLSSAGWNTLSREYGIEHKLNFVAPEMTGRLPAAPDLRTDIYSLGIIFYMLLTQDVPFPGSSALEVLQQILSRRLPSVSSKRYDVPDPLAAVIHKMTQKDIEERYHSMSGVKWDLEQIQKCLDEGDKPALESFKIASRDINSFFTLPNIQIGRSLEKDRVLRVIDRVSRKHPRMMPAGQRLHSPRSSRSSSSVADTDSISNRSKLSPIPTNSLSSTQESGAITLPPTVLEDHQDIANYSDAGVRSSDSFDKRRSFDTNQDYTLRSISVVSSTDAQGSLLRSASKYKRKGITEVVTVSGAPGLGKSSLLQSLLSEARTKGGYVSTSKFDQVKRTPFEAVLGIMKHLFRQIFSETDVDSQFHQSLRAFVRPVWHMLSAMLDLPSSLLDSQSHTGLLKVDSIAQHMAIRTSSTSTPRRVSSPAENGRICGGSGHTINDFLRTGAQSKSSRFMAVFVDVLRFLSTHHLLVLIIDDLQFADDESLDLLAGIITAKIPIVVVLTYRDKDQLSQKAQGLLAEAPGVTDVNLTPLREEDIAEYVSATLHRPRDYIFPLVAVIYEKTHGNPFFMKEVLDTSYRKGCIWYCWRENEWCFDLDKIFQEFSSSRYGYGDQIDNDFIMARMVDLPGLTRKFLSWASLLGTTFSFALVKALMTGIHHDHRSSTNNTIDSQLEATINVRKNPRNIHSLRAELPRQSSQDALKGLQGAINAYVIMPGEDDNHFRWCHDRYQMAATGLVDQKHIPEMHFAIAQLMLDTHEFDEDGDNIWIRARHICESLDIIRERVHIRARYRDALFQAAEKATESGGKAAGLKYFANALALLQQKDPWDENHVDTSYAETLQLFSRSAECYVQQGHIEPAQQLLAGIFKFAKTAHDKVPAWILQSRIISKRGDNAGALKVLKTCLSSLGHPLSDMSWEECDAKYKELKADLDTRDLQELYSRPPLVDQTVSTVSSVLIEALAAAFWTDALLFYNLALMETDIAVNQGNTGQASLAYIHMGCLAIGRFDEVEFGCKMGDLAQRFWDRSRSDTLTYGRSLTLFCILLGHFSSPMKAAISRLDLAMEACIAAGDRFGALMNVGFTAAARLYCSHDLTDIESYCNYGAEELTGWQDDVRGGVFITACRQYSRALQGKTWVTSADDVMSDEQHNSKSYLEYVCQRLSNPVRAQATYNSYRLAALFSYGYYQEVVELGNHLLPLLAEYWSVRISTSVPFYWSLAQMSLLRDDPESPEKESILADVKKHYDRIVRWGAVNDVNFNCWAAILRSQLDEVDGQIHSALMSYEVALDHAEVHELHFDYGLCSELYGEFMMRRRAKRPAKMAIQDAISAYRRISAFGKANTLAEKYEWLIKGTNSLHTLDVGTQTSGAVSAHHPPVRHDLTVQALEMERSPSDLADGSHLTPRESHGFAATGLDMIDLTGLLKSAQTLASELQIDRLFSKMCEIILESTSAEICAIIVNDEEQGWVLGGLSGGPGIDLEGGMALEQAESVVGKQIVLFSLRFQETVFLNNIYEDDRFSNVSQSYRKNHPEGRGVVCLPIMRGDTLLGCTYIEAAPRTLTERNVHVVRLLVNSLGISIANARLFKKVEKVSASNEAIVESQKQALARTKASENEAKAAVRRAEEAAKAKSAFLANVSHELRTPLNGVIGMSELLKSSQLTQEQEGYADSIRVCADTLLTVINDILDFSKLEAGKMQMFPVALSLADTIEEVVRALSFSGLGKDLETILDINLDRQLLVMSDPVRLHQILMNLLSNAYKFTPQGSVTVSAKVDWENDKEIQVTCSVADTGIGISEESKVKLFLPFSQADSSTARSYGGTGLGLSICRAIITNVMGGKIWLDSKEGEGTTVSFKLKLQKVNKQEGEATGKTKDPMAIYSTTREGSHDITPDLQELSQVPRAKLRVCIAEDNAVNMKIAMQFVKKIGLRAEAFADGQQAVDALTKASKDNDPYHVVLMDVQMPVLDGYDATRAIRKHEDPQVRKVLIIAMTASAIRGDREKCLEAGMNNYLAKPVRQQVLRQMLDSYLNNDVKGVPSVHRDSGGPDDHEAAKKQASKAEFKPKENGIKDNEAKKNGESAIAN